MIYTIEEKNLERQHLLAVFLEPISKDALDNISLQAGARILDIGCGIGETSRLLSKQFPGAIITGIDEDADLVEAASSENKTIDFVCGNALRLPFPDNHFDLVFARYLLHHIPAVEEALLEMKRVCKKGGIVFAQEPDINSIQSYPESWAYPQMKAITNALFADAFLGRKLISYFYQAELKNIQHCAGVHVGDGHSAMKRFLTLTAVAQRKAVLQHKLMEEEKIDAWVTECRRLEEDSQTTILSHPTVSVWGIR